MLWFWFFIIMLVLFIALLPPWPYMRDRELGYWPSGVALAVLALLLLLWWVGWIAMWAPVQPPVTR